MPQATIAERPIAPGGVVASSAAGKPATLDAAGISAELKRLQSSADGLATADAQSRLQKYGLNAIEAHEESLWHKLLGYFWAGPRCISAG